MNQTSTDTEIKRQKYAFAKRAMWLQLFAHCKWSPTKKKFTTIKMETEKKTIWNLCMKDNLKWFEWKWQWENGYYHDICSANAIHYDPLSSDLCRFCLYLWTFSFLIFLFMYSLGVTSHYFFFLSQPSEISILLSCKRQWTTNLGGSYRSNSE